MRNTPEQVEHLRGLLRAEMESVRDQIEAKGFDLEDQFAKLVPLLSNATLRDGKVVFGGQALTVALTPVPRKRRPPVLEVAGR